MAQSDATSPAGDPLVGSILCGYELLEPLARRTSSGVYLAGHEGGGAPVVVKVVFDQDMVGRYQRVLDALRGVTRPHLLPIVAAMRERGWLVVVSPYIPGGTLQDLRRDRPLTSGCLRQVTFQVAGALDALHAAQVVHRDVKPANILVERLSDDSVHAWLGDSWVAQVRSERVTEEGSFVGTIGYAAPEQSAGERVDGRADLFAFAVVMWEMLVGQRPFDRDDYAGTLFATVHDPLPPATGLSPLAEAVLAKALSKRPVDRYPTAREFADALWAALSADGAYATSPASPAPGGNWSLSPDTFQPGWDPMPPLAPQSVPPGPPAGAPAPAPGAGPITGAWAVPGSSEPSQAPAAPPPAPFEPVAGAPPPIPEAMPPAQTADPPRLPQRRSPTLGDSDEDVQVSVFAPPTAARGEPFFVQVLVHLLEQAERARAIALEFDEDAQRRAVRRLALPIVRGTRLTFELRMPGLEVSDPVDSMRWLGEPESLGFEVFVPEDLARSTVVGTVVVSRDSVPIGHVKFKLGIGEQTAGNIPAGVQSRDYRMAFVSYASADRPEVLKRVQMLTPARLGFFQDFLSLEPGQRWERELYKRIDECDVFLLFWSHHARDSQWVRKEAEYARARQGPQGLDPPEFFPVILEGPPAPEPWEEFEDLHFDDRLMYLIGATGGEPAATG